MRKSLLSCAFVTLFAMAAHVSADKLLFSDNFDSENGGNPTLNYYGFANWTVTNGSVDLIGNGYFDFLPGNGLYVDLDGSTGQAGTMVSTPFSLDAGAYVFQYELAGSQRGPMEPVTVEVGDGIASQYYNLDSDVPFTTFSIPFVLNAPQTVAFSFSEVGNSNQGELLDDVSLSSISVGTSAPLPASGLAGLVLMGCMVAVKYRQRSLA